jgi:CRISPR-associated protein Csx10
MTMQNNPIYLHYRLTLRSPAIVSTLSGDPNSAATQPFIAGGALRGFVASRLIADGVSANSVDFRRLVLSGAVRYLHAYPELAGGRSLPIPSAWRRQKLDPAAGFNLAAFSGMINSTDNDNLEDVWPQGNLAAIQASFVSAAISSGAYTITSPRTGSRIHQQRDRVKGRPWKDRQEQSRGALFAYEYLEPDQVFRGVIQFLPEFAADMERVKKLLSSAPILIGRSRRAGYGGLADVEFIYQTGQEYENVANQLTQDIKPESLFRVLLTSAYVGRHPKTGQLDPTALAKELCRRLGGTVSMERVYQNFETVGGFNQKWRLEVPQALAVAAGAVLVLRAQQLIPVSKLRAIEHGGIGERRVEGFGRILFLKYSDETEIRLDGERSQTHQASDVTFSEHDHQQIKFLEQRLVLAAAQAELDRVASGDLAGRTAGKLPTNSLLGRLRTLFRRATDEPSAQAALRHLQVWCGNSPQSLKENARKKLNACCINGQKLHAWLQQLAEAEHGTIGWDALVGASGNPDTLTALAARSCLTDRSAAEAVLHAHSALLRVYLIDAVLAALARRNRMRKI